MLQRLLKIHGSHYLRVEATLTLSEGRSHIAYKKVGTDILKDKGFEPREIHEEYSFLLANGLNKYIIDVVGIKDNYKIAIECGGVVLSKIIDLQKYFDEVIIVDAVKVTELYEYWRGRYFVEIKKLELIIAGLENENDRIRGWQNEAKASLTKMGENLEEENGDLKINEPEIIAVSKIFQRGKTVIPSEVRGLLCVSDGDRIVWRNDKIMKISKGAC